MLKSVKMDNSMNDVELLEYAKWDMLGWWKVSYILYTVPYSYTCEMSEKFHVHKVKGYLAKGMTIEMTRGNSLLYPKQYKLSIVSPLWA